MTLAWLLCVLFNSTAARNLLSGDEVDLHDWTLPAHTHDDGDVGMMTSVPSHLGTSKIRLSSRLSSTACDNAHHVYGVALVLLGKGNYRPKQ